LEVSDATNPEREGAFTPSERLAMPWTKLSHHLLLPELEMLEVFSGARSWVQYRVRSIAKEALCPRCPTLSSVLYDRRRVRVKDAPVRGQIVHLVIDKRRFFCKPCQKPFTEYIPGIKKGSRTTERFKREVLWACENFVDLSRVQRAYRVSAGYVFQTLYSKLEEKLKARQYPWPSTIGIDEHSFRRLKGRTEFASVVVDYPNKRIYELAQGKTTAELTGQLAHIEGRENVKNVILDLCDPFKNFAKGHFPNAKIIADKFHVLRLLSPALMRKRYEITGTRADAKARRLLLCSSHKLDHWERKAIWDYLGRYPELQELYRFKERLHKFYRMKGYYRAHLALRQMCDEMGCSPIPEIRTLRQTLMKWREEILNYFLTGLTNGRTEGYNNLAKLVQKRAFGYKSFRNYRLRLLSACA
jgi:transposase